MDDPQPGPSNAQIPTITHDTEEDSGSIPYVDSPESPPVVEIRKASIAGQQQLHDGIILLITSDSESQRSPNGSLGQHPLSEYYLLPLPPDALSANRRYSLQDKSGKNHHPERKASCPDTELRLSADRRGSSCSTRRSELDISKDRLTPTSFSSRRSSNASACHSSSRRSSNCSMGGHHHKRRPSTCSRRSSNSSVSHSRRSSTASHRSSPSHGSRRSSNCSRRSSHFDSDEESYLHHHHHHHCHRGSRSSLDPLHRGSTASVELGRRGSYLPPQQQKEELDEQEELEMGGIPPRHRRIIIMIIGSVSIFILVMSVVLIAVSLTLSPTIDDLGKPFLHYYF
ncbi:uncharacterized protein CDAR_491611 [Caerostris darwini]|uniref:Uncharacterized protein n=1 Tax=Caerostris darwini TaxID=1538125 RepID=A0AAV4X8G0_9ARAC|nr:uncharacterized protein CDAR_491611 [Caerostris darwini]